MHKEEARKGMEFWLFDCDCDMTWTIWGQKIEAFASWSWWSEGFKEGN